MNDGSMVVAICTLVMTAVFGMMVWLLKREIARYDSRRKQDIRWKILTLQRLQEIEWRLKITPRLDVVMPPDETIEGETA